MRALVYARCSTDESKQDVEVQLKELRNYCNKEQLEFDEMFDYSSGSKHIPENLRKALELIKKGLYTHFIVFDLSRFSRLHPSTQDKILSFITQECKCRFISLQEHIDSENQIMWNIIRHVFQHFSWVYSQNLSEKVRLGIKRKKEQGNYHGGRPSGSKDSKPRSKKGYYIRKKENPLNF
jgi:DNA invertase Pin-like site-specific DNA recombinase